MKRSVNEYDENRGGGYKIPEYTGKKADNTMSNIAMGMGVPAAAALVAGRVGQGNREAAQREKDEAAKRESDAEMKRESRGVVKPANFDAMEESKRDAKDRVNARKQDAAYDKAMPSPYKKGGAVKKYSKGGVTRADGIIKKGHTRGRMI